MRTAIDSFSACRLYRPFPLLVFQLCWLYGEENARPCAKRIKQSISCCRDRRSSNTACASHHLSFTGCVMSALSRERPHACLPNVVPEAFEGRVDYCDFPFPMRSVMLCYERSGRASGGFEHDRPICTTVSPWVPSRHRLVRWSCQDVRALRARARVCGSRVCV